MFNKAMTINESTFQLFALHALKDICARHNQKMMAHLPSSNRQSPVNSTGQPYDAGILLNDSYLVGMEFKVLHDGGFSSWRAEQHETYVALTSGANIELPLYYAYNALKGETYHPFYNDSRYQDILEGSNISTPKELPGQYPDVDAHQNMYQWLTNLIEDPSRATHNGWTTIYVGDTLLLDDILTGFPDIIWLLVTTHQGLRLSWALTRAEMMQHMSELRSIWQERRLRLADSNELQRAYVDSVNAIADRLKIIHSDVADQEANAGDMDDKPDNDHSSTPSMF